MRIPCPTCQRDTDEDAVLNGMCSQCRMEAERAKTKPYRVTWTDIRHTRAQLLERTDWFDTETAKGVVSAKKIRIMRKYRQALRDLPRNFKKPGDVEWPVMPE